MLSLRRAGLLLHITSLPGRYGVGDLGPEAHRFVGLLKYARQQIWQVLPLGPTGYGDSPYQSYSAFAGNPLLISPELLVEDGLLAAESLASGPGGAPGQVDFERITPWRMALLREAFQKFTGPRKRKLAGEYERFCEQQADWLDDYALFMTLHAQRPSGAWTDWPAELRARRPEALAGARRQFAEEIACQQFLQFVFFRQWAALRRHAHESGVLLFGDAPIFVSQDSADVWAHQGLFQLDSRGRPTKVAGVPPDYFSATGQRWGNPLYRWPKMSADGFRWWIDRVRVNFEHLDLLRLDHFRGFAGYWEIPAEAPTAATGRWAPGPGRKLFEALRRELGDLPIIAEDLGSITPDVDELREACGFPGMRVLQFGFGGNPADIHLPHNYVPNCVAYTGTHDNDTAQGWFQSESEGGSTRDAEQVADERAFALKYLNSDGREFHWDMVRAVWASVAGAAIAPVQDILGLNRTARMNLPGAGAGNWRWRLTPGQLGPLVLDRLAELTETYGRSAPSTAPPQDVKKKRKRKTPA